MDIKKIVLFIIILVILTACQPAAPSLSAEDLAATIVADHARAAAETAAAVVVAPAPTDETQPSAPPTQPPAPAETEPSEPVVTETAAPTVTHPPSGLSIVKDDFSVKSDIWGACDKCEWKDGKLYLGPFAPKGDGINQLFPIVCEACGEHIYFRIAADIKFAAGQAGDRFYGVGGVIPDIFYAGSSMTPYQYGSIEAYNYETKVWSGSGLDRYSVIKASTGTNHVEFLAKPNKSGNVDYIEIINGKKIITLLGREALSLKPALYVAWHSVGVSFDNFEFEELFP